MTSNAGHGSAPGRSAPVGWRETCFEAIVGWSEDDHSAALGPFLSSIDQLDHLPPALVSAARAIATTGSPAEARSFFETWFAPFVRQGSEDGPQPDSLATGFFEPVINAARAPSAALPVPLHRRPPDLVALTEDRFRGAAGDQLTYGRQTDQGVVPYATRAEIEAGAIDHFDLAFAYLASPVARFILQVQGSGVLRYAEDGAQERVTYEAKNGLPYTSVGRVLIEEGILPEKGLTLARLEAWLDDNPERAAEIMQRNASYVFFKPVERDIGAALGAAGAPLVPMRSIAVDAGVHALGLPVFVTIPDLKRDAERGQPFRKLTVAHDVGSAIRGEERCDLYFGTGDVAGAEAGALKAPVQLVVLHPRATAVA
ncbi:MAG: MltA domain-containing protein [Pseudomonadota bacterium]